MEQITSSYNLFVDTSRSHTTGSKGDDFQINLQDAGVKAGDGEHIRMNLENFSMAKNFPDVNASNNHIQVRATRDGTTFFTNQVIRLSPHNYNTVSDLATEFRDKMIIALNAMTTFGTVTPGTVSDLTPASNATHTDNIISFTLLYDGTQLTNTSNIYVQMFAEESDSFELLGGDRILGNVSATSTATSINVTVNTSSKKIYFACKYPAQRSTMPFIYVRAPGVLNTNIETKGLKDHKDNHKSDTAHSDILGRVVVVSKEFVQYTARTGREFFLDIHQKNLNFLRLKLTDSSNRPIPSFDGQSTSGNLNFSAVIRFDIVKTRNVQHLETEHYVPNVPARFSKGIVTQQRDGQNTYFKNPGM